MTPTGFRPATPTRKRPQTNVLERAPNGIGREKHHDAILIFNLHVTVLVVTVGRTASSVDICAVCGNRSNVGDQMILFKALVAYFQVLIPAVVYSGCGKTREIRFKGRR
jgi:hypothetical protein